MKKFVLVVFSIYTAAFVLLFKCYLDTCAKYERAAANIKSYENYLNSTDSIVIKLNRNLAELSQSKNEIEKKLLHTIDSLKIKRKRVKEIQYIESTFKVNDTIFFRDSIYTPLDTIFGNKWYTIDLIMADKFVSISPSFKSEKHVIVENRKETIEPPKKFFLFRWFQKKHWVQYVTVEEKNPYIETDKNYFININSE